MAIVPLGGCLPWRALMARDQHRFWQRRLYVCPRSVTQGIFCFRPFHRVQKSSPTSPDGTPGAQSALGWRGQQAQPRTAPLPRSSPYHVPWSCMGRTSTVPSMGGVPGGCPPAHTGIARVRGLPQARATPSAPSAFDEPPETGIFRDAHNRRGALGTVGLPTPLALEALAFKAPIFIPVPEAFERVHDGLLP